MLDEDHESVRYQVNMTDEAFYAYTALPTDRIFSHVDKNLSLLETTPELGHEYDPAYPAARPPFACRVLYCENYGVYYRIDTDTRTVVVFAIEDQRRNPLGRFSSYEYEVVSLPEDEKS
ncbi:type II toxin-antitoxin system RelE/ParE family toxin [Eggerthella sp. YY7918]|uniref:type II toxin-antitoxin system RelE/ParE family toxin n=1 Tax=Eggerthella sp. (strain YY7918) TaxID=502558 RepID=UPI000217169E|nr:type II toxin-antitoxin system RelE/ParE family toxin [Eggerthella sp. YY7918]BAK45000.1 alanyl-tRNA synthetase [Eggerthella sp. YY7918]